MHDLSSRLALNKADRAVNEGTNDPLQATRRHNRTAPYTTRVPTPRIFFTPSRTLRRQQQLSPAVFSRKLPIMSLENTALDDQAVLCISRTLASAPSCAVLGRVFSLPDWLALGRTHMEEGTQDGGSSRAEERESVEYKCACVGCNRGRTFLIRSHPRRQL